MEPVTKNLPVIAMRGLNVFPRMNTSFDLERPISVHALERAMENGEEIFLVTQREIGVEQPEEKDLYEIGTVARVTQILRVSDRVLRVMMAGACRARLKRLWQREPFLQAQVELIDEPATSCHSKRTEAMLRQTYASVTEYAELAQKLPDDVYAAILSTNDPGYLADFIAQQLNLRYQDKQDILDELRPLPRLQRMNEILRREIEVTAMEQDIESKVRSRVGKIQKDFVLREQIKVLQNEIGEGGEDEELDEYREKISKAHLSEEVERKLLKDVDKLAKQPFGSAEASVLRNYLDTCMEMPWGEETKERASVDAARKILDRDHYGLQKVKERILEFIAVRQLNPKAKGQILCLVGPPGVGKTSIALSVAKAMNRKVARLSLGGVRDEADIRGHRKTYIGAMPGRIIEAISRSGSMNPLLVLDEVDKMGSDGRGDPASALLEVLDSEQNYAFRDHYLEIPVDLSRVMFIMTANTLDTIPRPLLDRMEIIEIPSYTDEEKVQIAQRHLLPKERQAHGLTASSLRVDESAIRAALSCLRQRAQELGIAPDFYKTKDIHIHFPEGAIPKDGPSAGIAIATAVLSALTGQAVHRDVAMTGEITLRGRVLAIGGLREKTMGALRAGVHTVILPKENEKDLDEIDPLVREKLRFVPVETVDAVFAEALVLPEKCTAAALESYLPPVQESAHSALRAGEMS